MPQQPENENMPDFQRWHSRGSGIRDSQICIHGLIKAFKEKYGYTNSLLFQLQRFIILWNGVIGKH